MVIEKKKKVDGLELILRTGQGSVCASRSFNELSYHAFDVPGRHANG